MAAAQTPAEKAQADQIAAETAAAEKVEAEKAAAAKADAAKPATAKPASTGSTKAPALVVLGPVAVLPLKSGGERYVYRGAPVGDEYTPAGIKHAQSVGLVGKPKK